MTRTELLPTVSSPPGTQHGLSALDPSDRSAIPHTNTLAQPLTDRTLGAHGRRLTVPAGRATRPTSERVREALASALEATGLRRQDRIALAALLLFAFIGIPLGAAAEPSTVATAAQAAEQQEADYRVIAARCGTPAFEHASCLSGA